MELYRFHNPFSPDPNNLLLLAVPKILHSFSGSISQVLGGLNGLSFIGLIIKEIGWFTYR